jgi:hypothetical protein
VLCLVPGTGTEPAPALAPALLQAIGVLLVVGEVHGLSPPGWGARVRMGGAGAERQGDGVAGPRVDGDGAGRRLQVDERVERVLLQVADDDLLHCRLQILDDVPDQVVCHRPRRLDVLDLQRDGVGLEHATQIGGTFCPSRSRRMMIGMLVIGSTISPLRGRWRASQGT